jgi:hypothetical protein
MSYDVRTTVPRSVSMTHRNLASKLKLDALYELGPVMQGFLTNRNLEGLKALTNRNLDGLTGPMGHNFRSSPFRLSPVPL